jgi:hypothetical protein
MARVNGASMRHQCAMMRRIRALLSIGAVLTYGCTIRGVDFCGSRLYAAADSNIAGLLDQSRLIRHQSAEICAKQEKDASEVTHSGASMRHFCVWV